MKEGEKFIAKWPDELVLTGSFLKEDRGYIILEDGTGKVIVCDPSCVKFEMICAEEE